MTVRLNLVLSEDLNNDLERMASKGQTNKSEIIRKALQLFLAAQEGKSRGLKLGLVEPETRTMQTEFIGL